MLIGAEQSLRMRNGVASAHNVNWDDGRLFLAVARAGQMLAAARTLGVNQATLSRRMTALETDLGVRLLIRRTTGCDLTDEGRRLLRELEPAEGAFAFAEELSVGRQAGPVGTVRIGAPDGFGAMFLAPLLGEVRERYPGLAIQLVPIPRSFSLSQREADVAVMIERPTQGRLAARKLTDYSLSLYGARSYLERYGRPRTEADLAAHSLVGYVEDLLYAPALDYGAEFFPGWKNTIEISTAVGQMAAVSGGAGIGILHDYLAAKAQDLELLLPHKRVVRSYWTVVHESQRGLLRIASIVNLIHELVRRSAGNFVRLP